MGLVTMTKEKLYRKTVHLEGIDIFNQYDKAMVPRSKNWEIAHHQIADTKQKETYTTFLSQDQGDINRALSKLSERMLVSDRVRTINRVPKYRIIKGQVVRSN